VQVYTVYTSGLVVTGHESKFIIGQFRKSVSNSSTEVKLYT